MDSMNGKTIYFWSQTVGKVLVISLGIFIAIPTNVLASTKHFTQSSSFKNWQISGALGLSQLGAGDNKYTFNPGVTVETDDLVNKRGTHQLHTKVGIGHNLFAERLAQNDILTNLLVEVNFYNFSGAIYGKVEQYDSPSSNDINFTLDIKSNQRLMLDFKPSLFTYRGFSPYLVIGAGVAWIETEYREINNDNPANRARVTAPLTTNRKLVFEGGGGINYAFNHHFGCYIEYLFTRFGKVSTANATYTDHNQNRTYSVNSPEFSSIYTNAGLFGLYFKI